jgi:hypothetical protein
MTEDPSQKQAMDDFLSDGDGGWFTLYLSEHDANGGGTSRFAVLPQPTDRDEILSDTSWDVTPGSARPGFSVSWQDGVEEATYVRGYESDGMEPIVHLRELEGPFEPLPELTEDFRLFHNLFAKGTPDRLFLYDEAANETVAAELSVDRVRARTTLVRSYLAARQLDLVLLHVSDVFQLALAAGDPIYSEQTPTSHLEYWRTDLVESVASRLRGKRVVAAPPQVQCGVWPFAAPKEYGSFIVGIDGEGNPTRFSSDPSGLSNSFGSNAGSPAYLTPVYFRPEVLAKYFGDTTRYSVEDGYLRCAGSWGMQIDNNQAEYVIAFLGDLGRDLPLSEQVYWRSYNIEPQGPMSDTAVRRSFMAEFADAVAPDLRFKVAYKTCNDAWKTCFGWPLFKPLHDDDQHVLTALHVPLSDTQAEFDTQMTYLAKAMVDSINEDEFDKHLSKVKDEKGISKFERFLNQHGYDGASTAAQYLRHIYGARTKAAAHRKGSDFDVSRIIGSADRRSGFAALLEQASEILMALATFAEENAS